MKLVRVLALAAIVFLVACVPTTPSDVDQVGTETPGADIPTDVALVFHRSGGLAGVDEKWVIRRDGQIDVPRGEPWQVDPAEVEALLETIQAVGFFSLDDSYIPSDTCCDRFTYTITVQFEGKAKTVSTIDAAPSQPDQLMTVIDAISTWLFR